MSGTPDADGMACRPVAVTGDDGTPIVVHIRGAQEMTPADVEAFGEIVRAAQRRFRRERPDAGWS